jgi:hypothetical protein
MISRNLCKSYVVKPYRIISKMINGEARSSGRKGITTHGKVCDLCKGTKLIYQTCSRVRAALGPLFIRDIDGSRYYGSIYGFGYI